MKLDVSSFKKNIFFKPTFEANDLSEFCNYITKVPKLAANDLWAFSNYELGISESTKLSIELLNLTFLIYIWLVSIVPDEENIVEFT